MDSCFLVLEDGSVFPGKSFGHPPPSVSELEEEHPRMPAGEVVFNTGMAGYHEILTDPSYSGQIIVMTYPHIGNYGTDEEWSEYGPGEQAAACGESTKKSSGEKKNITSDGEQENGNDEKWRRIKASALVVRSLYSGPLPAGRTTLDQYLKQYRITGITDVDTRRLTLRIRDGGSPIGIIVRTGLAKNGIPGKEDLDRIMKYIIGFPNMEGRDLVSGLGTQRIVRLNPDGCPHISLVDCGTKAGIIRRLISCNCSVSLVPNTIGSNELLSLRTNGILFSNGPGDPRVLKHLVALAHELIGRIPLFGICLGHQILSLALGAEIYKMKFGHHGVNNPVRDEETGIVLITSQNHGFAVEEASLPPDCRIWFRNVNDNTVEGILHRNQPILAAQFHPEAAPGPLDSHWIFKRFLERI